MSVHRLFKVDFVIILLVSILTGYALFAYGLTSESTKRNFDIGLGAVLVVWLLSLVLSRRLPAVKRLFFILSVVLLLQGWVSVWNAQSDHSWSVLEDEVAIMLNDGDLDLEQVRVLLKLEGTEQSLVARSAVSENLSIDQIKSMVRTVMEEKARQPYKIKKAQESDERPVGWLLPKKSSPKLAWLPGSIDQSRSFADMIHISLLLAGGWMISDLCRNRGNRKLLLEIFVLTGLAFVLLGLFLKASGENSLYYSSKDGPIWRGAKSFASYRYHGNAATILNFFWPIALVLFLANLVRGQNTLSRTVFACGAFFTLAALFVNTSKFGQVITPFLLVAFLVFYWKPIRGLSEGLPHKKIIGIIFALLILVGVAALAKLTLSQSVERWADWRGSAEVRMGVYQTCVSMVKKAGFFGMGPGAFSAAFPYFLAAEGKSSSVFYQNAHQDYLQGLIEWGWLGFGIWMSLLILVFLESVKRIRSGSFYTAAILIAVISAVLQAFVDFPAQIASLQWVGILLCAVLVSPSLKISTSR